MIFQKVWRFGYNFSMRFHKIFGNQTSCSLHFQSMEIELRIEEEKDYFEAENVVRNAFWNQFQPGCDEHYLLHTMRNSPSFIPELDTVAVYHEQIIGNIVYLKSHIISDDGNKYEVLSLGPLAVLPEYQRKGVGGKLIDYTRKIAQEMGFRAIFLYGDPDYYTKKGFVSAETKQIRTEDNLYHAAMHVCELYPDALSGITGRYMENDIYFGDQTKAQEFDTQFPKKELVTGTPSQKRFQLISTSVRKPE